MGVIFCFPKFNQIWCVSYLHEWHMHRCHFYGAPLVPWGGAKRSNIIKSKLQSQFQRFLNPTHIIRPPGSYPGVGLGGTMGVGGHFFMKSNQIWCVSYSHEWHMHRHNFLGPRPLGPWGGVKKYFSGHGHVEYQIKGDEQDTLNNFNLRSNW